MGMMSRRCARLVLWTSAFCFAAIGGTEAREPLDAVLSHIAPTAPGCVFGIYENGILTRSGVRGLGETKRRESLTPQSLFNIGSVSKQFTAFALLLLEQDGRVSLDDSIRKYVPELGPYAQRVSLRHLLHHTGGLREYIDLLLLDGRDFRQTTTQRQAIRLLAMQTAANNASGVEYAYSNTGYFLLGLVVERVSGQSLARFAAKNIFAPLNMTNTVIVDRYPARIPRLARGYSPDEAGFTIDESPWQQTGDGQVHTSIDDLQYWIRNLETAQLGGKALIERLVQAGALNDGTAIGYAGGLRTSPYRGLASISHGGDWVGYVAHLRMFPAQRFAASALCNRSDEDPARLTARIADDHLDTLLREPFVPHSVRALSAEPSTVDVSSLPDGLFRNPTTGAYVQLSQAKGSKQLVQGQTQQSLEAVETGGARVYRVGSTGSQYAVFKGAAWSAQVILQDSVQPYTYTLVDERTVDRPECFAGRYTSTETSAVLTLEENSSAPSVSYRGTRLKLTSGMKGEFFGVGVPAEDEPFTLRFHADTARLTLFTAGVRGVEFTRTGARCRPATRQ